MVFPPMSGLKCFDKTEGQGIRENPRGLSENSVRLAAWQARLAERAQRKFSSPTDWLWTSKLLEQASDEYVARMTASAYPDQVCVLDLCCGAGSDSVALARRGPVIAVDQCPVACELAYANLRRHFPPTAGHKNRSHFRRDRQESGVRGLSQSGGSDLARQPSMDSYRS